MITITSYLHRDALHDIILRWMYNEARPSDSDLIFRQVHFNNLYVSRYLKILSENLFRKLHPESDLHVKRAALKGDLKDAIVADLPYRNLRIDELILNYHRFPEAFYRETPFHGTLFFKGCNGVSQYIGSNRIKRVRRLAEKSARRIIDRIFDTIKKHADKMADDRAMRLGIRRQDMVSRPEDMTEEFLKAENRLLKDLRYRRKPQDSGELVINDVAGIKVIIENPKQEHLLNLLDQMDDCEVIEKELHAGKYNAANLIVRYEPPRRQILSCPLGDKTLAFMRAGGLSPGEANKEFGEFVWSGEKSVHVEIIVSTYQEMLESEIGRCMHEDRIIEQRLRQEYNGQIARNVEYLMEYLFAFSISARNNLGELPIRLWNRYLPDYFDEVLKQLYRIPSIEMLE